MPLTISNLNKQTGVFELVNESNEHVGTGRAQPSHRPGFVTLYFSPSALPGLNGGLRIPINWLAEGSY